LGFPSVRAAGQAPDQEAEALFDVRGAVRRSLSAAVGANALALAVARQRGHGYDPAEHACFVAAMMAACTPAFFER
jgi:hypothetical protein